MNVILGIIYSGYCCIGVYDTARNLSRIGKMRVDIFKIIQYIF